MTPDRLGAGLGLGAPLKPVGLKVHADVSIQTGCDYIHDDRVSNRAEP